MTNKERAELGEQIVTHAHTLFGDHYASADTIIPDILADLMHACDQGDQMPPFDYDKLLWGERQIRSVANMTREDARDFLKLAHDLKIQPRVTKFTLEDANRALLAVKDETVNGSAVIVL